MYMNATASGPVRLSIQVYMCIQAPRASRGIYLGKEFFGASTRLNVHQRVVSILYHPVSEGTHAQLNQHSVVQDLVNGGKKMITARFPF